ncbi:MAG TPA: diacylglycerol kinase family protein [Candidatus Dormibacteraeota bacterium]|nr:diacylglycerol kinase family protein [Candidatus Dormibacteraeota bacterium]
MEDILVVVNPASGGGRTGREWPAAAERLRAAGLRFDAALTTRPGEATELARRGVHEGRSAVVAAGGDGTIHEVVNGFFEGCERIASATRLGVLPMGTGGDFRRTIGMSRDAGEAAQVLLAGRTRRIDAGRVTCAGGDGSRAVRHFVNIADAGIGADVSDMVNGGFKVINGELTFSIAAGVTLMRWRNRPMHVVVDGEERDLVAQQVVVANCQYYGGGMRIAPAAVPDDGLLDLVIVGDVGRLENVRLMGKVREGAHLPHPKLEHRLVRRVEVNSPERVGVDADGERPGSLPAVFEVLPGALELLAP